MVQNSSVNVFCVRTLGSNAFSFEHFVEKRSNRTFERVFDHFFLVLLFKRGVRTSLRKVFNCFVNSVCYISKNLFKQYVQTQRLNTLVDTTVDVTWLNS